MNFSHKLFLVLLSFILINCRHSDTPTSTLEYASGFDKKVTVTSPTLRENWFPGTTQLITWDADKKFEKVDIFLYRKDIKIMTIAENVDNSSTYLWNVPDNINFSHHYRIKVESSSIKEVGNFSEYFYIIGNSEGQLN